MLNFSADTANRMLASLKAGKWNRDTQILAAAAATGVVSLIGWRYFATKSETPEELDERTTRELRKDAGLPVIVEVLEERTSYPFEVKDELEEIFISFCSFGKGNASKLMSGNLFTKTLRDSNVFKQTKLRSFDADLTFAKIVAKGKKKIGYSKFVKALAEMAKRGKTTKEALVSLIIAKGGPTARGTKADNVRLANKDHFVGVHTRGGPSICQSGNLLDRSAYDVRGCKIRRDTKLSPRSRRLNRRTQVEDASRR